MNRMRLVIGRLKPSVVNGLAVGYSVLIARKKLAYFIVPLLVGLLLFGITPPSSTQIATQTVPDWIGLPVTLQMNVSAMSNPSTTHEELPGLGHKFELIGAMMDDDDPENLTNDTISVTMTITNFALAFRNLPPGVKITAFDSQLGFKYYFVAPRSCGGGSPRVTLLIDSDGDGNFNFAAHGHPNPFAGCPPNTWVYENLTDNGPRWEITPGGAVVGIPVFPFSTWDTLEAAITPQFPNHKVLAGFLVDDSCSFFPASCGKAYYDLLTIENRTLENDQDTVRNGN